MDERLRRLRLERGQALLESCRMREVERSPEETARLKQRGLMLYEERLRAEENRGTCAVTRRYSDAVVELRSYDVNEGYVMTETTEGLSFVLPQPVELVSDGRTDGDNVSISHDGTTAIIDYSILDSVREQHIRDVRQIEILTKESLLLQETIDRQKEELNRLAAELAQRDAQIHCMSREAMGKLHSSNDHDTDERNDSHFDHMQVEANNSHPHAKHHHNNSHLEASEALERAETLLARKESEIQELQRRLQEEILRCNKIEEENKILIKAKEELQEEMTVLLQQIGMPPDKITKTEDRGTFYTTTTQYLEQPPPELQSDHNPSTTISEDKTRQDEINSLVRRCAEAERGREAAEAAMHRVEAEMMAEIAGLKEELCRMQQSHEEELKAAEAAMQRTEADTKSQQPQRETTRLAGQPRGAAAPSKNPFASMGVPSKDPGLFADYGDDGDDGIDVFGVDTEQPPAAAGDAASGERGAEQEDLVAELRGRLADLEAGLASATLARDSAVGEAERLARQCADAEAAVHRVEAEMMAEIAGLKEELCRMQRSHEEELKAAEAAMQRTEADTKSQQPQRETTRLAGQPRGAAAPSKNPFASMGVPSKDPGLFADYGDDGDDGIDVFGVDTEQPPAAAGDAASGERGAEQEDLVAELRGRLADLEAGLASATLARDSAVGEAERLARQCADAEAAVHRVEAEMMAEIAGLKEELCRMQQSHEEELKAAEAAMQRTEADTTSQQPQRETTRLAGQPRGAAAPSKNPFASMGVPSKDPGLFADYGDDGDDGIDVFGVDTEQPPAAAGDAASGERGAEQEDLVAELRGRLADLEAGLASATLARDSAVGEAERLARQCADAEAAMHRVEAEMMAEIAGLKEELCRMQRSHEEELEAALLEASDRIAEHDDLLRQKLEEQEAELEAGFLERLRSCKGTDADPAALQSLLNLTEENARLKEELCRMQQSHEEELKAAEAAMQRTEADTTSQQPQRETTRLAGQPRGAAAPSKNPFASMGVPSKDPGLFADYGDDGDDGIDVFGVDTEQPPAAAGDAASGERGAEQEDLVAELRGRLADLEAGLASATLARDSAVGEAERLARQCADAEAAMHRVEAEMMAEIAGLKEELCRMQRSHEEELEAALLEASDRIAEHDDLLRQKLEEQEAELEAGFLERLRSCKGTDADPAALQSLLNLTEENARLKEELCRMQQSHEEELKAAEAAMQRTEADTTSQQPQRETTRLAGQPRGAAAPSKNPFASMGVPSKDPGLFADYGDDGDDGIDVFGVDTEQPPAAAGDAASGERGAEQEDLVAELRGRLADLEAGLASATLARDSAVGEAERLARQCADAEAAVHRVEAEMMAEIAGLKEELCRMQRSHEEELEAALLEASDRIAEHDDLLRQKLEEQEAELEAGFLERLRSCKGTDADPAALQSLLNLTEENARLKEELCRMQQSHEEELKAAEAAMQRTEADTTSQQPQRETTRLAGQPRGAAAPSKNPFASMGVPSKDPGLFADYGDDGDDGIDVFGVDTEQPPAAAGDAASGERGAEQEDLVAELRGRLADLEAGLASATLARDSAVGEAERLARQCADAEAAMRRVEAEMMAEIAGLKEELCRMQRSHEEELEAALLEASDRIAEHDDLLRQKLEEQEAELEAGFLERLRSCKGTDADPAALQSLLNLTEENARLKEELCRMQQSHEEELKAAEAAMQRTEADTTSQQPQRETTRLAGQPRGAAAPSKNPFASMGVPSKDPGLFADYGDDGDDGIDVFGVDTEQPPAAAGDAASGERGAEQEDLVAELRGRLADLEAGLASATLARDSAVGEAERLARQCADAEAAMRRVEAEMMAEIAGLKEELCRMQRSHEEELEAALLEASDRIAEHDDLLRQKLEEQEAELEAGFLERLRSCKGTDADPAALQSLLNLTEENARLKEELCRMQQSHEEELKAAEAAMQRTEADTTSQQPQRETTRLAGQPRGAAAPSKNPFASMGVPSKDPGLFADYGDDGDDGIDVFGVDTEQPPAAAGDAASGERGAEQEDLVAELRGRLADLEAGLASATLARDSAVGEAERLARQCADAEAAMRRVEAEMMAEIAGLKEELCRMQRSHEEELEAALLEASDRIAEHDDLLRQKLEEQEAELEAGFLERLRSCKGTDADPAALQSLLNLTEENARLKEELCRMQQSHEEELKAAEAAMQRTEADTTSQQPQRETTRLAGQPRGAAAPSKNPFASMGVPSKDPGLFADYGDDGDDGIDVFGVDTEQPPAAAGDAASGERGAEQEDLVAELRGRLADLEAGLASATLARDSAVGEAERLARQCADAEAAMHRVEAEMMAEIAGLKEELCRMQRSHEEELEAALLEASDRIAEHDDLLRQKLEEQEAELEAGFLERLRSCKGTDADPAALQSLLNLTEENARLKEELCRMQQSHEEELEAALLEASDRIAEHDDLLRQKLEEQEEYYEKLLVERPILEPSRALEGELGDVSFWKDAYDKLYEQFEQLQSDFELRLREGSEGKEGDWEVHEVACAGEAAFVDERLQTPDDMGLNDVESLKRQISVLQRMKEQEEERVTVQAKELRELQERLREKEKSCSEFSQMYEEAAALLHDGATSVEMLLQEKRTRIEELESQIEKISQEVLLAEERLRLARVELQQRQHEVDEGAEKYLRLEAAHRAVGAELREVKRLLEERQRTWSQRLERVQGDMEKQMHDASEELRRVRYEHEQEGNGLRREIDRLRAELQAAQTLAATTPLTAQGNHHQLGHLRQQLAEAVSEKMQLVAELEAAQQLLHTKKDGMLRGRQHGGDDGSEAGDSGQSSDARINSLLQRTESLEGKVRQLTADKETLLQEKDTLELELQSSRRMVEVRDLACQRQTDEVKQSRTQIAAMKDDLSFRIQSCNTLRQELNEAQEQAAELARAYEDLQVVTFAEQRNLLLREHLEALLLAKAMTVPRVMQDVLHGIMQAHQRLLQRCSENQRNLLARCDAIEQTATEAMIEGERQSNELLSIIEDAKAEQQQLRAIIERLEMELAAANRVAKESTEEAAAAKTFSTEATHDAREEASRAKSELQALQLEYNSAVNTISLLESEKANAARLLARANLRLEEQAAEQQQEVARLHEALLEKTHLLRDAQETAKKKLEAVELQAEDYKAQRDDAAKRAQAAQVSLDRVLPRLQRLEAEQAAREAELMETTQQLTELSQRSTSTEVVSRRHVEALNATLAELRSSHAALSEKCTNAYAHADELKTQLTANEAELARLRTRIAQQEQEAEVAQARLTELESIYVHDTSDAATWRRDAERRSATLERRNSALQEELQTSQKQQCILQERVDLMEAKLRQMSDEHQTKDQQQRRSIQQLRERCEILEGELGKLEEANAGLSSERDVLHRDCLGAKQDVGRLEHHLETVNQHNEQLHKELRRQKESHDAELQMVRKTLAGAQEELSQCRCTLLEAETREKEVQHVVYALKKENARYVEELQQMRGLADSEQEFMVRERAQKQERVAELHEEVVQLQKELHAARQECKMLESKCTQHADDAELLRRQLAERTDRLRTLQQDAAAQHEQLTATVKSLRAELATLQLKLDDAVDTLAQKQREYEQYEERSLRKLEVSQLSEETLRKEVADLQWDLRQLQQKLASATTAAHDAEKNAAQQQATIRTLREELGRHNVESTAYLEEREHLQSALREKTLQLEQVTRRASADLETALASTNEQHRSNSDRLEAAVRREQQAAQEARTARDRALASLEQRQGECERLQAEVARLQQMLRSAQAQVASTQAEIKSTVTQVVVEAGLPQEGELSLGSVVNQLLLRLSRLSHAAVLLDVEVSQFKSFEKACEAHAAALRCVMDATRSPPQVSASGTTPTSPILPFFDSSSGSSAQSLRQRSISSHPRVLQDIVSSASTYAHRLMDHCHTLRGMLDNMEVAFVQCDTSFAGDPAVARVKLVVMATLSELHLRTSRQTALLSQIIDGAIMSAALQDAIRFLRDDETYVLRPFNELLMPSSSSPLATPRWGGGGGGGGQEPTSFTTTRVSSADNGSVSQYFRRASTKKESEPPSRILAGPPQPTESGSVRGEGPRRSSIPASSGADASVASTATMVDASTGQGSSSTHWCVNHDMRDAA